MKFNSIGAPVIVAIDGADVSLPKLTVRDWIEAQDVAIESERSRLLRDLDAAGIVEPTDRLNALRQFVIEHSGTGIAAMWLCTAPGAVWVIERSLCKAGMAKDTIDRMSLAPLDLNALALTLAGMARQDADPQTAGATVEVTTAMNSTSFTPPA